MSQTEQLIKAYTSGIAIWNGAHQRFKRDASKLAKQGWRVQSQSYVSGPFGRAHLSVVYTREVGAEVQQQPQAQKKSLYERTGWKQVMADAREKGHNNRLATRLRGEAQQGWDELAERYREQVPPFPKPPWKK